MGLVKAQSSVAMGFFLIAIACADPTQNTSSLRELVIADAVTNSKDGFVVTPDGYYHSSCVHGVEEGALVDKNGLVRNRDGSSYKLPTCLYAKRPFVAHESVVRQDLLATASATVSDSGIIEAAQLFMPSGNYVSKLLANYTVPARPLGIPYHSAGAYFAYAGIDNGFTFLKPVIQYGHSGAGGDTFNWGMASWACTGGSGCVFSPFKTIVAGDAITTATYSANCPGVNCQWTIAMTDLTRSLSTSTGILDNHAYTYATGGRVEVSDLGYCDMYPVNNVAFSQIKLYDKNGVLVTPSWTTYIQTSATPQCRFAVAFSPTSVTLSHNTVTVTASGSIVAGAYLTGMTGSGSTITLKDNTGQTQTVSLSGFTASGGLSAGSKINSITASGGNTITLQDAAGHTGVITMSAALAQGGGASFTGFGTVSFVQNTITLGGNSGIATWINLYR